MPGALAEPDRSWANGNPASPRSRGAARGLHQQLAPHRGELGALLIGSARRRDPADTIPASAPISTSQRVGIEDGNGVAERAASAAEFRARLRDAAPPACRWRPRSARRSARGGSPSIDAVAAEILGDQKALVEIGVADRGRGEAALAQAVGDGDERLDVFGEMHRGAVGLCRRRSPGHPDAAANSSG